MANLKTEDVAQLTALKDVIVEKDAQEYLNRFEPFINKEPPNHVINLVGGRDRFLAMASEINKNIAIIKKDFPKISCTEPEATEYEDQKEVVEAREAIG